MAFILDSLDHSRQSRPFSTVSTILDSLVHKCPLFCRLVREILQNEAGERLSGGYRITGDAMTALHTAAEAYLVGLLEDANLITLHSRCVTLQPKDIQLVRRIRGEQSQLQDPSLARFGVPSAPRSVNFWSSAAHNDDAVHVSVNKM